MEKLNKEQEDNLRQWEASLRKAINQYILKEREKKQWISKYLGK